MIIKAGHFYRHRETGVVWLVLQVSEDMAEAVVLNDDCPRIEMWSLERMDGWFDCEVEPLWRDVRELGVFHAAMMGETDG